MLPTSLKYVVLLKRYGLLPCGYFETMRDALEYTKGDEELYEIREIGK